MNGWMNTYREMSSEIVLFCLAHEEFLFISCVSFWWKQRRGKERKKEREKESEREREWERKSERERGRMRVGGRGRGSKYLDWVILTPQIDILSERRHCPLPLELSTDFPSVELQAPLINLAECSSVIWNDLCGLYSFFFFYHLAHSHSLTVTTPLNLTSIKSDFY